MNIDSIIQLQKEIAPELFELIEKRYNILLNIYSHQPIGRRTLANNLKLGERIVRSETIRLQEENLIDIQRHGMLLTEKGRAMVERLKRLMHEVGGLSETEKEVKKLLSLEKVIIVPGDVEENLTILNMMGYAAANYIKEVLKNGMKIGVTGGSSVASVAEEMPKINLPNITVIPARGGMGKDASRQANNIAANLAEKLNASYELLHMPDAVEGEVLQALIANPLIKQILDMMKTLDVLVYGVGRADIMAERRGLPQEKKEFLVKNHAVSEAFGHYFDPKGNIIYRSSSVGISMEDFKKIPHVIAVSGGASKAEAIMASCKIRKDLVLITDESAAKAIIENNQEILRRN